MRSDKILQIKEWNDLYDRIEENWWKCPNCDLLFFDIHHNFCLNPDCLYNVAHGTIVAQTKPTIKNIIEINIYKDPYDQKRHWNW